jgi:predicted nucleic acid-binding protein
VSDVLVDSSVLVALLLVDEPAHGPARRFRETLLADDRDPVVAAHCRFEVRHALVRAARQGRVEWEAIPGMLAAVDAVGWTEVELSEEDRPVLDLARMHQLSWGDAHWVEVAARLDLPLVTADQRLIRSVPDEVAILVDVRGAAA